MNTIRFTHKQFEDLRKYLFSFLGKEAAAFLIAGHFRNDTGDHFVVREIMYPAVGDYDQQLDIHLEVSADYMNKVIAKAEQEGLCVGICHSHIKENRSLAYGPSDDYGELALSRTLYDCLMGKPMPSLLFDHKNIVGRFRLSPNTKPIDINEIRLVGRRLEFITLTNPKTKADTNNSIYSRQVLALGKQYQQRLETLKAGIVGLGGTGSAVAEQLTRMGIKSLVLVDKDTFESSNLTRVYGSIASDSKTHTPKIQIAERNIRAISPDSVLECYGDVISQRVLQRLKNCDVLFSCTDRHAPRSVLNELSYQYFIPVIDVGAGLDAKNNQIEGGTIRATVVGPTLPCLFCSDVIRPDIIGEEFLSEEKRQALKKEGYIKGLTTKHAPSVISFTTLAAGFGVHLLLDLLSGFMRTQSYNYLIDIQTLSASRLASSITATCTCTKRFGRGDYMPLSAP